MLSVVVPVYNVAPYLPRCLESLQNQELKDIEFIIVNDGSTDDSLEICEAFIEKKPAFSLISKKNEGLMAAWMDGVALAKGDYVGFVDSDDYVDSTMYDKLYRIAADFQADVVMCNHAYVIDGVENDNVPAIKEGYYSKAHMAVIYKKIFPKVAQPYISPSRCNKIIRTSVLRANLEFCDTRIFSGEDVNIIIPVMLSAESFYYLNEPLYKYVKRHSSITYTYDGKRYDTYLILLDRLRTALAHYDRLDCFEEYEDTVNAYAYALTDNILNSELDVRQKQREIYRLMDTPVFKETAVRSRDRQKQIHARIFNFAVRHRSPGICVGKHRIHRLFKRLKYGRHWHA